MVLVLIFFPTGCERSFDRRPDGFSGKEVPTGVSLPTAGLNFERRKMSALGVVVFDGVECERGVSSLGKVWGRRNGKEIMSGSGNAFDVSCGDGFNESEKVDRGVDLDCRMGANLGCFGHDSKNGLLVLGWQKVSRKSSKLVLHGLCV